MSRYLLVVTLLSFCFLTSAQQEDWFEELDKELEKEWYYVQQKEQRIDSLKRLISVNNTNGKEWERYQLLRKIADEYTVYVFRFSHVLLSKSN